MSANFLLEVGTEELPSSAIATWLEHMPRLFSEQAKSARLGHGALKVWATPRRLALWVESLAAAQTSFEELRQGPPVSIGRDAEGKPTRAALAFLQKQGLPENTPFQTIDSPKGPLLAVMVSEKGVPAREVLGALVVRCLGALPFGKSMRWGDGDKAISFSRPVRWLVALHGGEVVPFTYAHLTAGRQSRGHRFLANKTFDIASADAYQETLNKHFVDVDDAARQAQLAKLLDEAARSAGLVLLPDAFLLEENTRLVEWPHAIVGSFDKKFLELPRDVIISVLRNHQRYFALTDKHGALAASYVCVANTAQNVAKIKHGNDRVLRARLSDAAFFVAEDRKLALEAHAAKLAGITFHHKLGSVADKVARLQALLGRYESTVKELGVDVGELKQAAGLAKADLTTLSVGEFPELQGLLGAWLAQSEKLTANVVRAIAGHYQPKGAQDALPSDKLSAWVGLADRADTLVGCFGIGLQPSGSADPYALRRAALAIVRLMLDGPFELPLSTFLSWAYDAYPEGKLGKKEETINSVTDFVRRRLQAYFAENYSAAVVDACLEVWDFAYLRDLRERIVAVDALKSSEALASLAVLYKRAYNIAKTTEANAFDEALFEHGEERELAAALKALREPLNTAINSKKYTQALEMIAEKLRQPIDAFFAKVLVMAENPKIKANRLYLLRAVVEQVRRVVALDQLAQG